MHGAERFNTKSSNSNVTEAFLWQDKYLVTKKSDIIIIEFEKIAIRLSKNVQTNIVWKASKYEPEKTIWTLFTQCK